MENTQKNCFTQSTSQISLYKASYQYSNTNSRTFNMHRRFVKNTIFDITKALTLNVIRQIRISTALMRANSVKDQETETGNLHLVFLTHGVDGIPTKCLHRI